MVNIALVSNLKWTKNKFYFVSTNKLDTYIDQNFHAVTILVLSRAIAAVAKICGAIRRNGCKVFNQQS